jgi:hypothetical protein
MKKTREMQDNGIYPGKNEYLFLHINIGKEWTTHGEKTAAGY